MRDYCITEHALVAGAKETIAADPESVIVRSEDFPRVKKVPLEMLFS
jgi:hypothetical protein